MALLCSATSQSSSSSCDLSSSSSLTACVRNIIEDSRADLKKKFDPLRVKSHSGGIGKDLKWSVKDVYINGLSGYKIRSLNVRSEGTKIKVDLHVFWPKIVGGAKANVAKCVKIFIRRQCFKAHGQARVSLVRPSVKLSTALLLSMKGTKPTVKPSNTDIKVNLPGIDVQAKIDGLLGRVLGLAKKPVRKITNKFAKIFWKKSKRKIQKKMELKFNELVTVHLARKLPSLLTGLNRLNLGL